MACERWCLDRGWDTARRWPFALLLLTLCVCGSALVSEERDDSYYNYGLLSSAKTSLDYRSPHFDFVPEANAPLVRKRRMPVESVTTAEPERRATSPASQQQPQKDQPKQQQQQQPAPTVHENQQQQQPQQPAAPQPKQDAQQPVTPASSANVTYSTDYGTAEVSVTTESAEVADKSENAKQKKVKIPQVPKPSYPPSAKAEMGRTIWANRTQWPNATAKAETRNDTKVAVLVDDESSSNKEKEKADSDIGDISISKFSDVTNKTLSQNNITKTEVDTHQYYNSTFIVDEATGKKYWVDIDHFPDHKVDHLLSKSYRRATTVKLTFDFPFYGHKVRNITIATGGFLYTGEYVHSWLAATQYIAPLMANFDTRLSNESQVKYADNGTSFTVEWEKVILQDRPEAGAFTFQVTLHQNGDIVFVYPVIPLVVEEIEDTAHPVKVGLSDAYIMDRTVFLVRRKTIYEYHRVNFNRQDIKNWTVIYLKALPTCLEMDNCRDCLTKVPEFDCKWCKELNQCSTGTFRSRQDWLTKGCDYRNVKEPDNCPPATTSYKENNDGYDHEGSVVTGDAIPVSRSNSDSLQAKGPDTSPLEHSRDNMSMSVSGIIGILIVVVLVTGLAAWAAYAYRNPHTASGQMLIRYRPSQWSWRRGEARYTAATIHM